MDLSADIQEPSPYRPPAAALSPLTEFDPSHSQKDQHSLQAQCHLQIC